MEGRTAIVTGSTSGIGLGIAHALAAAGANVVLNGRGSEEENAEIIASVSGTARAWPTRRPTCCATTRSPR